MFNEFYENRLIPFISQVRTACRAGALPLSFDNSLSYYEQLAAFSAKLNEIICAVNNQNIFICDFMTELQDAFAALSGDFAEKWEEIQSEFTVIGGKINGMKLDISDLDERVTALENLPAGGVGETVEPGTFYRIGGMETPTPPEYGDYETETNCEIFNEYAGENGAAGNYSHSEGFHTRAMTDYSHTEGINTIAAGTYGVAAHAEGSGTIATGAAAHAEGSNARAYGAYSHAEGAGTRATGGNSHAGGGGCISSGNCSFAHGNTCTASAINSVAFGAQTIAGGNNQLVCGYDNIEKGNEYLFIIGNGVTSSERSNAFEVDRNGNVFSAALPEALNVMIENNENNISKDKAALIELVDGGAKSLLPITATSATLQGYTYTINTDGTIDVTGTGSSTTVWFQLNSSVSLKAGKYVLSGGLSTSARVIISPTTTLSDAIAVSEGEPAEFTLNADTNNLIYAIRVPRELSDVNFHFTPMLCTKAAWDISPTYQPYRPSEDEQNAQITQNTNDIANNTLKVVLSQQANLSTTYTYQMKTNDFSAPNSCGCYMISIITWGTTPTYSLYSVAYSGNHTDYTVITKIAGSDADVTVSSNTISVTSNGKVTIIAIK